MYIDVLSWILILIGSALTIISAVGIIRLPDVFTRMHAGGIGDTLALGALVGGMMLQAGWSIVTIKLALILLFMFFASPTTSHALAKAAIAGGVKPYVDENEQKKYDAPDSGADDKGENQ